MVWTKKENIMNNNNLIGWIDNQEVTQKEVISENNLDIQWDDQTKWAVLLTLAGYKESNFIHVNGNNFFDKSSLDEFGSFILNDTRAAPRHFDIKTSFKDINYSKIPNNLNNDKFDSLLSFSGGIDSTAGLLLELARNKKPLPLWIGFGQKNENDEMKIIANISSKLGIEVKKIRINFKEYVDSGWSRWKLGIIPARNYLFASLAANLVNKLINKKSRILICAHKEEITPINTDKSEKFFETSSKIFSDYYKKDISVETPFRWFTKPEIVSIWHRQWEGKFKIKPQDTVSCYFGNNCGVCKACINRAIAFTCAGVDIENFIENPFMDKQSIIKDSYLKRFDILEKERKLDFLYALKTNNRIVPQYIKKFLDENYEKYQEEIKDRILHISTISLE